MVFWVLGHTHEQRFWGSGWTMDSLQVRSKRQHLQDWHVIQTPVSDKASRRSHARTKIRQYKYVTQEKTRITTARDAPIATRTFHRSMSSIRYPVLVLILCLQGAQSVELVSDEQVICPNPQSTRVRDHGQYSIDSHCIVGRWGARCQFGTLNNSLQISTQHEGINSEGKSVDFQCWVYLMYAV